ncbi:zona pellucida sperm-binding protein 3 [Betta splendens]|uniref:Zona pellucida sperm-binding protein 3 n=1 Tax=Betta splendens TaxID=158456 RepID=A0A6P7LIY1_BETSP|nr:zona pellucida sperm-binding protein 3 [Betta splendens]
MKTHWQKLYLLWSVLALGLSCAADTRAPQFAGRRTHLQLIAPTSKLTKVSATDGRASASTASASEARLQSDFAYLPDVSVTCSVSDFVVRVKPSFYGLGAHADELRLGGGCRSNGVLRPYGDLLFTYPLTACGAVRERPHGYLVYKLVLHYESSRRRSPGATRRVDVDIECRYPRDHHVYQLAVKPTWQPAVLRKRLKGRPSDFQITIMDDSWSQSAKSQVYQLGKMVNFQISASHLPKRRKLYVSSCYAAPSIDAKPPLKYTIIDNMGCMRDSKREPEASRFVSRTDRTLRFSLKAFQFTADPDTEINIHCKLSIASDAPDSAHKSCTYTGNRWKALAGDDSICDCCDSQCVTSKRRRATFEGSASIGLLVSDQSFMTEDVSTSTYDTELHGWENVGEMTDLDEYDGGKKERGSKSAEGNRVTPGGWTEPDSDPSHGVPLEAWDITGVDSDEFGEEAPGLEVGDLLESREPTGRPEQGIHLHSEEVLRWAQSAPRNSKEQEEEAEYTRGNKEESRGESESDHHLPDDDKGEKSWYFTWR